MTETKLATALVYDFDGTLAEGNVQEGNLFQDYLDVDKDQFWDEVKRFKEEHDASETLVYMYKILEHARAKEKPITERILRKQAEKIKLFEGVQDWFDRINDHGAARNLDVQHFIISSGNQEIIEGSSIAQHFKRIFACRYAYDATGQAIWPAAAIDYTTKTQYLFRINKGVLNSHNNDAVNKWIPMGERPIPFTRMIFVGDGDTDIPAMKMVRHQRGHAVAVFNPKTWGNTRKKKKAQKLIAEDRANFVVPANYSLGSQLDITIKGILGRIARDEAGYRTDD